MGLIPLVSLYVACIMTVIRKIESGAGEVALRLRALATLGEKLSLSSSTHMMVHNHSALFLHALALGMHLMHRHLFVEDMETHDHF